MAKIWRIMLKELTIVARDRTALLLMFGLPLSLILVMSFAFGRGGGGATLSDIPVVIVNNDSGELGQALVDLFFSDDLSDLLAPELSDDEASALARLANDEIAAVVVTPQNLTDSLFGSPESFIAQESAEPAQILVYGNPLRRVSTGVVAAVTEQFAQTVNTGSYALVVTFQQLIVTGRMLPAEAEAEGEIMGERIITGMIDRNLLTLVRAEAETAENPFSGGFDWLSYAAPSMAILGLMFSMMGSARSLLVERQEGTLARLRTAPLDAWQIIVGKALGTFTTGLAQMAILILVTWFALQVHWGQPAPLIIFTALLVAAMAALGMLLAAFARTAAQANALGTAVVLLLSGVSGTFVPRSQFPEWLQQLSKIGPVAWGLEGFTKLAQGATLSQLTPELLALSSMTVLFLAIGLWGYRRVLQ